MSLSSRVSSGYASIRKADGGRPGNPGPALDRLYRVETLATSLLDTEVHPIDVRVEPEVVGVHEVATLQ